MRLIKPESRPGSIESNRQKLAGRAGARRSDRQSYHSQASTATRSLYTPHPSLPASHSCLPCPPQCALPPVSAPPASASAARPNSPAAPSLTEPAPLTPIMGQTLSEPVVDKHSHAGKDDRSVHTPRSLVALRPGRRTALVAPPRAGSAPPPPRRRQCTRSRIRPGELSGGLFKSHSDLYSHTVSQRTGLS